MVIWLLHWWCDQYYNENGSVHDVTSPDIITVWLFIIVTCACKWWSYFKDLFKLRRFFFQDEHWNTAGFCLIECVGFGCTVKSCVEYFHFVLKKHCHLTQVLCPARYTLGSSILWLYIVSFSSPIWVFGLSGWWLPGIWHPTLIDLQHTSYIAGTTRRTDGT